MTDFTCERGLAYCEDNKGCYEKKDVVMEHLIAVITQMKKIVTALYIQHQNVCMIYFFNCLFCNSICKSQFWRKMQSRYFAMKCRLALAVLQKFCTLVTYIKHDRTQWENIVQGYRKKH